MRAEDPRIQLVCGMTYNKPPLEGQRPLKREQRFGSHFGSSPPARGTRQLETGRVLLPSNNTASKSSLFLRGLPFVFSCKITLLSCPPPVKSVAGPRLQLLGPAHPETRGCIMDCVDNNSTILQQTNSHSLRHTRDVPCFSGNQSRTWSDHTNFVKKSGSQQSVSHFVNLLHYLSIYTMHFKYTKPLL